MKRTALVLLLLILNSVSWGQNHSAVFKVRAPKSVCSVFMEDSVFWLEKQNKVRVIVRSKNPNIRVFFAKAKVISKDSNNYVISFDAPGSTVISVFEMNGKRSKLIFTKGYKVKEPTLYFCGVKVGTISHVYKMREEHFKAYSTALQVPIHILQFDMVFNDQVSNKIFHSDSCMLTKEMKDLIFNKFRFGEGRILLFSNIQAAMPDGSKKVLSPFGIFLERDSSNTDDVAFNFSVKKIIKKNGNGFKFN